MHKYGKVHYLGHKLNNGILASGKLIITEKVDGACFRFAKAGPIGMMSKRIVYGTRRTELGLIDDIDDEPCKKCQRHKVEKCHHTFYFVAKWIEENVDVDELEEGFVYYGEAGIKHTLSYETLPPFTGFDIWVESEELGFDRWEDDGRVPGSRFVSWGPTTRIFKRLGIPTVPVLWEGSATEWVGKPKNLEVLISKSSFGDVKMEGIVMKNYERVNAYGRQLFAKIKREEFQEMAKASFGTKPKDMALSFETVEKFCNAVRIDNAINKLVLEGQELEMRMMRLLFKYVGDDILQEQILDIAGGARGRGFDFKAFYDMVAKKCAKRLQERMVEESN